MVFFNACLIWFIIFLIVTFSTCRTNKQERTHSVHVSPPFVNVYILTYYCEVITSFWLDCYICTQVWSRCAQISSSRFAVFDDCQRQRKRCRCSDREFAHRPRRLGGIHVRSPHYDHYQREQRLTLFHYVTSCSIVCDFNSMKVGMLYWPWVLCVHIVGGVIPPYHYLLRAHVQFLTPRVLTFYITRYRPSHLLLLDHERRAVVLVFRGTLGIHDVLTDLVCKQRQHGDGNAHGGMLEAAQR
jgi:hypothetical protein